MIVAIRSGRRKSADLVKSDEKQTEAALNSAEPDPGRSRTSVVADDLAATVVICAYTERRWPQTHAAIESVLRQDPRPRQVILVVDYNPDLATRARHELGGVTVLDNDGVQGLSGARNTGLRAATQPVTVFLDDDAEARQGWLATLLDPYQRADVVATGGSVHPRWPQLRPRWLPATFDWVVGCSYAGLPESVEAVRNPIGANMSLRTGLALEVGGFDSSVGRVRGKPRGCEETELAIRLTASSPGSSVLYVPGAAVDHHVAADRVSVGYFVRRCWNEGLSKATVVRLAGSGPGLERERRQVRVVIPMAMLGDLRRLVTGDLGGGSRMAVALGGLVATVAGYLSGRTLLASRQRRARIGGGQAGAEGASA